MSSVSEPLAPTSASADSTIIAADASRDASPATDSTTTTDNPTTAVDPTPVEAGPTVEAAAATVAADASPVQSRPKKKRRWLRAVGWVAAAAVIVTMTGATGYVADHHHVHIGVYPEPASSYHASPAPIKTTPPARDHGGDLRRFLLPKPPSADHWVNHEAPNGTMNIKQLAFFYDDPKSGAAYLKSAGFKNGATAVWQDSAKNIVEIRLERFDTANDAYSFYQDDIGSVPDARDTKGTTGAPVLRADRGAMVFSGGKKEKDGTFTSKGIAYRGDVFVEIWVTQTAPESAALTEGLIYQQWNRL
jgi:hypothetical protein